ncbi:MAG: hypothetical protein ABI165_14745 [Bryobacteraceae bacterium]
MTPFRSRARRLAFYLFPSLFCLAVNWYALRSWFGHDDLAWLGLWQDVQSWSDLWYVLFHPFAQGTVRVFSERMFFLAMRPIFNLHGLPYHAVMFLTQFANLMLLGAIALRLTRSRVAGLLAPVFWSVNAGLAFTLAWVSGYNQILCAFCMLAAFYFLLRYIETNDRKFLLAQWIVFLLGFGVLEIIVVYPALAALYALCFARRYFRRTLALFIPSLLFTAVHTLYIPKTANPIYRLYFDSDLPKTLAHYVIWCFSPTALGGFLDERWKPAALIGGAIVALLVFGFAAWQLWRRQWLALFFIGWFSCVIAPVLPLRNHISAYYLVLPAIGLSMLGAWAFATAWHNGTAFRTVACFAAVFYLAVSIAEARTETHWYMAESRRLQDVVKAVDATHKLHPQSILLLAGVDQGLFDSGFQDRPFRLVGTTKVFLAPGSEAGLRARKDLGGLAPFTISLGDAARALDSGKAEVLEISGRRIQQVTGRYAIVLGAEYRAHFPGRVDVGDPQFAGHLGSGWYRIENGFRWMSKRATVQIAGPKGPGWGVVVSGYAPAVVVKSGPLMLQVTAGGVDLGSAALRRPDRRFNLPFPLPESLVDRYAMEVTLEVSRTLRLPDDGRDLGMAVTTIEVKKLAAAGDRQNEIPSRKSP